MKMKVMIEFIEFDLVSYLVYEEVDVLYLFH